MESKIIPVLVMLIAGGIQCICGIFIHTSNVVFCKRLLFVLILFYIIGWVVKMLLDTTIQKDKQGEHLDGE